MNPFKLPFDPGPESRLSLDLPTDHHQMMEEVGRVLSLKSKIDVVREALGFNYALLMLAAQGYEIAFRDTKTGQITPLRGSMFGPVTRKARHQKELEAQAKPEASSQLCMMQSFFIPRVSANTPSDRGSLKLARRRF